MRPKLPTANFQLPVNSKVKKLFNWKLIGHWPFDIGSSLLGFTLIELLVVISLIALLLGFSIPAYNSYNRSQQLTQSGTLLVQTLHQAQNSAISGAAAGNCPVNPNAPAGGPTNYDFDGWYATITPSTSNSQPAVTISGSCGAVNGAPADVGAKPTVQFPSQNLTLTVGPTNVQTYILFQPVTQQAQFYTDRQFKNAVSGTSVTLTLTQGSSAAYVVTINSNGSVQTNQ